jgi:hypothetical protein
LCLDKSSQEFIEIKASPQPKAGFLFAKGCKRVLKGVCMSRESVEYRGICGDMGFRPEVKVQETPAGIDEVIDREEVPSSFAILTIHNWVRMISGV